MTIELDHALFNNGMDTCTLTVTASDSCMFTVITVMSANLIMCALQQSGFRTITANIVQKYGSYGSHVK